MLDDTEILVHRGQLEVLGAAYEVLVFTRNDGTHVAKTVLGHNDILINDGPTLQEVLDKHQRLLPLAIDSRVIMRDFYDGRRKHMN